LYQQSQKQIADLKHPTQLRFKGITITPGGFLEAAGIFNVSKELGAVALRLLLKPKTFADGSGPDCNSRI
jgi:hypothetical protein